MLLLYYHVMSLQIDRLKPPYAIVWPYRSAPEELQALSSHGGDEDYLAFVAGIDMELGFADGSPPLRVLFEHNPQFGCCDISEHPMLDGSVVLIGAHA